MIHCDDENWFGLARVSEFQDGLDKWPYISIEVKDFLQIGLEESPLIYYVNDS